MKQVRADTGIVHLRVARAQSLSEFLLETNFAPLAVEPTHELLEEWLHYGCIYIDGRRVRDDQQLQIGQVLRLHTRRKNYVVGVERLASRVVFDHEEFLILDKPAGVPTHPTLDNYVDNAQYRLARDLGYPVFVTHRLDIPTQGLLIFAKNQKAQAALNKVFAKGRVEKVYRALTASVVAPGEHAHAMDPESRVPKAVSLTPVEGWWTCRLEVQLSEPHPMGAFNQIRLLTGKTHQIRAQFAALGAPILGDQVYGSSRTYLIPEGIALECYQMEFPFRSQSYAVTRPRSLREEQW